MAIQTVYHLALLPHVASAPDPLSVEAVDQVAGAFLLADRGVHQLAVDTRQSRTLRKLASIEPESRTALAAETALLGLQRERVGAWVALYRAAGGG